MIISNAFSLNMFETLEGEILSRELSVTEISKEQAVELLTDPELGGVDSAVGHADTAALFSTILGIEIPCERKTIQLNPENGWLIVGQYHGPRLEEGSTTLPEGASIRWYEIEIKS
ncbi:MAG: DUF1874 domain-containing protein [Candidatus Paceibacterota bacterium]